MRLNAIPTTAMSLLNAHRFGTFNQAVIKSAEIDVRKRVEPEAGQERFIAALNLRRSP